MDAFKTINHVVRSAGIGRSAWFKDPDGNLIDEATWNRNKENWLPSGDDGEFIKSLMKPVTEPGKFARWIAPACTRARSR